MSPGWCFLSAYKETFINVSDKLQNVHWQRISFVFCQNIQSCNTTCIYSIRLCLGSAWLMFEKDEKVCRDLRNNTYINIQPGWEPRSLVPKSNNTGSNYFPWERELVVYEHNFWVFPVAVKWWNDLTDQSIRWIRPWRLIITLNTCFLWSLIRLLLYFKKTSQTWWFTFFCFISEQTDVENWGEDASVHVCLSWNKIRGK